MRRWFAVLVLVLLAPMGRAEQDNRVADIDRLITALDIAGLVEIMRDEGLEYADEIANSMLGGGDQMWAITVARVYDVQVMIDSIRKALIAGLDADAVAGNLTFFQSVLGQRIIQLENSARRAMLEPEIEQIARGRFAAIRDTDDARLARIQAFVTANDLIEVNVAGGLSANYMFFRGMVDGGAMQLSDAEIRADVWRQEADIRADTYEWVYSFLLMAYQPLSDGDMDDYVALSRTSAGRALNTALFRGFDDMYRTIAHGLGKAAARALGGQEL